jgi:hypothetical protein
MRCGITTTVDHGSELATWAWYGDTVRPAKSVGLDWSHVNCCLALLACGILFGLFVGGFVGFTENAAPHGGEPWSLTQLATSDVRWTAMARRYRAASHQPSEPGSKSGAESRWLHLVRGTTASNESGHEGRALSSVGGDERLVRRQSPLGSDIHDTVVTP